MKTVRHFGIVVKNMKKSLKFYQELLGLDVWREMEEEGGFIDTLLGLQQVKVKTVKLAADDGDTLVELLEYKAPKTKKEGKREIFDFGPSHIAFTVGNVDQEYERLESAGVKFISSPQISPDEKAKVAFCYDPDGIPVELVQEL